jgi:hypothetical protein
MQLPQFNRRTTLGLLTSSIAASLSPRAALAAAQPKPWLGTPRQIAAERMVLTLLKDPAIRKLQAQIRAELAASDRARTIADAMKTLDGAIAQWTNSLIFAEVQKNVWRPAFLWGTDDTPRSWNGYTLGGVGTSGDNPDNIYRTACIEGGGRYEILGQYHPDSQPTQLLIEVHSADIARPGTMMTPTASGSGKAPDPHAASQISKEQIVADASGRFRITVGGEPDGPNHLAIPDSGLLTIGVRDVLADWKLRPAALTINRLDKVDPQPFGIREVRELVLRDLKGYIAFWANFPNIWFGGLKPNAHSPAQKRPGGWGFVAGLNFHLAPDQAMVVTTSSGGAKYTGFQLNDPWMIAPDARTHQVCLNISQVTPNADGTVTYVISASDPGVANWLDATGLQDGLGIMRWQAVPPDLTSDGLIREVRVITLPEARNLPGVPRVSPAERRATLVRRKHDYETRTR